MLIVLAVAVPLLVGAFGVAAWQVTRQDRIERGAMADRVDELLQREGLHIASIEEQDGVTTIGLRGDSDTQPRS